MNALKDWELSKKLSFAAGFLGWYLVNGIIWWSLGGSGPQRYHYMYASRLFLANGIIMLALVAIRPTRIFGLGVLAAIAANFAFSLIMGAMDNGICFIPFFS